MADKARSGAARVRRAGLSELDTSVRGTGERTAVRAKTSAAAAKPAATRARADSATVAPARSADDPPATLPVRPGEDPWTAAEVAELEQELQSDAATLRAEIHASEEAVSGLMRDSGDGAGDDQVDAGTKNISREHEMSLAANAREMLEQTERALVRLAGTAFGLCESCGQPIGKARVQAFPRATLCVQCKQKQERR